MDGIKHGKRDWYKIITRSLLSAASLLAVNISVAKRPRDKILNAGCVSPMHLLPASTVALRVDVLRCDASMPFLYRGFERLMTNLISLPPWFLDRYFWKEGRWRKGEIESSASAFTRYSTIINISSFAYRARDATICIPLFFSLLLPAPVLPFSPFRIKRTSWTDLFLHPVSFPSILFTSAFSLLVFLFFFLSFQR